MNNSKTRVLLGLRNTGFSLSVNGRYRLPRSLLWYLFRHSRSVIHVDDFDGDLELDLSLSEHMQRRIFWMGYYNLQIVPFLKKFLATGMTFIDIGANIGELSMVAAKCVGTSGKVIAFEPVDVIADQLQANLERNRLQQVSVVRMGLADTHDDRVPIYASCGQGRVGDENHGLSSLYGQTTGDTPTQFVTVTKLDAYLGTLGVQRVDLIKIDIEGAELPCLRGAETTLRRFQPALIVEVQEPTASTAGYKARDILDFLSTLGYSFSRFRPDGTMESIDTNRLNITQNVFCSVDASTV